MIGALTMGLLLAAPAVISTPPQLTAEEQKAVQRSARLGRMIYFLDQAAARSTDALKARVDPDRLGEVGGYVVEPGGKRLRATYYRGQGAEARAFFVAEVERGKVRQATLLETPVPLTEAQSRLAAARDAATRKAVEQGYKPCTAAPFNSVVIGSSEGSSLVYLLSAQLSHDAYPIGGHFRFLVAPDGKVVSHEAISASCLTLQLPKKSEGKAPAALVATNSLSDVPREIFPFASYSLRLPIYVITRDKRLWHVKGEAIRLQEGKATP